jgi:hypothetical protein
MPPNAIFRAGLGGGEMLSAAWDPHLWPSSNTWQNHGSKTNYFYSCVLKQVVRFLENDDKLMIGYENRDDSMSVSTYSQREC